MTSSWFFLSTLNYDARSTTHQIYIKRNLKNRVSLPTAEGGHTWTQRQLMFGYTPLFRKPGNPLLIRDRVPFVIPKRRMRNDINNVQAMTQLTEEAR